MREPHAPAGAHEGVGVHPRLLGEEGELHQRAVDDDAEAAHEGHVVFVSSAESRHLGHLAHDEEDDGAGNDHEGRQHIPCRRHPPGRRDESGGEAISRQYHHHHAEAEDAPAQVVEYLPAADGVHLVFHALAPLVAHVWREPRDDLPVATRPAVVPLGVVDIVRRVVVEEFHVVD